MIFILRYDDLFNKFQNLGLKRITSTETNWQFIFMILIKYKYILKILFIINYKLKNINRNLYFKLRCVYVYTNLCKTHEYYNQYKLYNSSLC